MSIRISVTLENIGPVTKADLELGQITVIVGENNVGKSFVLKSIYSIFKAFEMEQMLLRDEVERALRTCGRSLSVRLRLFREIFREPDEELVELKEKISNLLRDIEFCLKEDVLTLSLDDIAKLIKDTANVVRRVDVVIEKNIKDLEKFIRRRRDVKEEFIEKKIMLSALRRSRAHKLEKLHEKIRSLESVEKRLKIAWKILINDIFSKAIVKFGSDMGKISVKNVVSFSFDRDIKMDIKRSPDIEELLYSITPIFVESPLLLEIKPYLAKTTERRIKSLDIPIHIGSLLDYAETILEIEEDELTKEIRELIGGEVYYSIDEGRFYFKSEQYEKPFEIQNVASGIKSFGVLQLLLRSKARENTIFLWEEPESHLHPDWQIKFAEIVAKIVKRNNYFVISTHSPFMAEILRVVAKENEIDAKFYYMNRNSELIEVNDENWYIISDSLLRPLRKIAYRLFKVA